MPLSTWSEEFMPEYLRQYGWTLKQDMETRGDKMFSWTYHDRQQAQMITPFLYLGTISTMKDEEFLRTTGITMVLALRQPNRFEQIIMTRAANVAYGLGIQVAEFAVATVQNLRSILPQTVSVMEQHLSVSIQQTGQPGKIFVACQTGNERSATVVCAFLMVYLTLHFP
jgi:serine/threonine/tyrosine-interacting protein